MFPTKPDLITEYCGRSCPTGKTSSLLEQQVKTAGCNLSSEVLRVLEPDFLLNFFLKNVEPKFWYYRQLNDDSSSSNAQRDGSDGFDLRKCEYRERVTRAAGDGNEAGAYSCLSFCAVQRLRPMQELSTHSVTHVVLMWKSWLYLTGSNTLLGFEYCRVESSARRSAIQQKRAGGGC